MKKSKKPVIKQTLHRYFLRTNVERSKKQGETSTGETTTDPVTITNMAADDLSNSQLRDQLRELILGSEEKIDKKLNEGFTELKENMNTLNTKIEKVEADMEEMKVTQTENQQRIENVDSKVGALQNALLQAQTHARKYNLLVYGIEGYETTPEDSIKKIRDFATTHLKMDEEFVAKMAIRNAHRLQRRDPPATSPIIVVFLYWSDRETFLRAGKHLAGKRMSIRTDLPPELKIKRGSLARRAFELRRDENIQARVRERGIDVWLETRMDREDGWKRSAQ